MKKQSAITTIMSNSDTQEYVGDLEILRRSKGLFAIYRGILDERYVWKCIGCEKTLKKLDTIEKATIWLKRCRDGGYLICHQCKTRNVVAQDELGDLIFSKIDNKLD